jgi:hypothetical protein
MCESDQYAAAAAAMAALPDQYKRVGIVHEILGGETVEIEREYVIQGDPTTNPFVPYDRDTVYGIWPHSDKDLCLDPTDSMYKKEVEGMIAEHARYERRTLIAWRKESHPNWDPESYEDFCQRNTYAMYKTTDEYKLEEDVFCEADIFLDEPLGTWEMDGLHNWHYHRFEDELQFKVGTYLKQPKDFMMHVVVTDYHCEIDANTGSLIVQHLVYGFSHAKGAFSKLI